MILKAFVEVDFNTFRTSSSINLRGHSLKLYKQNCKLDIGSKLTSFIKKVLDVWNKTRYLIDTVSGFKKHLDNYIFNRRLI